MKMGEGNQVAPIHDGTVHQGAFESIMAGLNLKHAPESPWRTS